MMLALISAAFAGEAGAAAGRVEFVVGGVTVAGRDGVQRPLARGTELDNGDTVRTNDGRAQIRFTDGAYTSLQPNTEFGIRDYRFENRADGNERGFFGLLKGAMRTVTGAIGRINRDRYQISTPTATVGIRGTGGVIQVQDDGSTLVIGTSGIWSLTNPAGSVDVPAGTSALAPTDPNQPPQETTQAPTSGPAPVQEEPVEFVAGEERNTRGEIVIPQPSALVSGSGFAAALAYTTFGSSPGLDGGEFGGFQSAAAVFDSLGRLTAITDSGFSGTIQMAALNPSAATPGTHAEFGTDGILAWGRWTGTVTIFGFEGTLTEVYSANQGFHYVVGMPTASLPTSGSATYSLLGASSPTYADGLLPPGSLTGGTLGVSWGTGSYDVSLANFRVQMSDAQYTFSGSQTVFSATAFFGMSGSVTSPTSCSCSGCGATVTGFFAGTNAERAGVAYHIQDFDRSKDILGAAAFTKN
jgi:hypothetical protein